ncbi:hypothetical protein OROHE_019953 [Orobanche hederae]
MNSEEERKIAKRVKGLTIHDQRRNNPPNIHRAPMSKKEIGKLTVDEYVVKVLFAEKGPDEMTYDEICDALYDIFPESHYPRKRKRAENVDVVGPSSGGEVPKADGVQVAMDCDGEGPKEKEEGK